MKIISENNLPQKFSTTHLAGCHKRSSEGHCTENTKFLQIRNSLYLLCEQYNVSAHFLKRPSNPIFTRISGLRTKKFSLQSRYIDSIRPFLPANLSTTGHIYSIHKQAHSMTVQEAICNTQPNLVL